jgi:hypothetical protein
MHVRPHVYNAGPELDVVRYGFHDVRYGRQVRQGGFGWSAPIAFIVRLELTASMHEQRGSDDHVFDTDDLVSDVRVVIAISR